MNEDKKLEALTNKLMKSSKLFNPSDDFTSKLMLKLSAEVKVQKKAYVPIFSNLQLVFIVAAAAVLIIISIFNDLSLGQNQYIILNTLLENRFLKFSEFQFSKATIYATMIFTIAFFVQIIWIKKRYRIY